MQCRINILFIVNLCVTATWGKQMSKLLTATFALALSCLTSAHAEKLGEVSTAFKLLGPDHKISMEAYDDPKIAGVTCYVSRSVTGGISGALGLATDKSEASIACRQVGAIKFKDAIPKQEEVFNERLSILFKTLRIVRVVDVQRQVLLYLTYSDKLIDGSPKNSLTAVPVNGVEIKLK